MRVTSEIVPESLRARVAGRPADGEDLGSGPSGVGGVDGDTWLASLPHLVEQCLDEWRLTLDGEPAHGECALVLPVRHDGERAALKITWPHAEARHEHLALRAWRGVGAVRLRAADPSRWALLLERLEPATRLHEMSALDACETIGAIHARLAHPALPQLGTSNDWCTRIEQRLATNPPPVPRRMVSQGLSLARDLRGDGASGLSLVHSDLHDDNVMSARRAGTVDSFVAIDPKPITGPRALAVAPLVWNRWDEAAQAYNLRNHLRFRVDYACDPMGVRPEDARAWAIVRLLDDAWWQCADASRRHAPVPDLTKTVAIIKAMQG